MKKILLFILCLFMLALPFSVYAEEATGTESETIYTEEMTIADDTIDVTDNPVSGAEGEDFAKLISKRFEEWIIPRLEEISVIITLIGTLIYQIRKNKALAKSMGTMNNNTVAIAEQSSTMMNQALTGIENVSNIVTAYDARIEALLEAHRSTAADKERLEKELSEIRTYLKTSAESNIEFANELAELLGLANIPNYKKEEIGARHVAAVNSIKAAENEALASVQEVSNYDHGEEA